MIIALTTSIGGLAIIITCSIIIFFLVCFPITFCIIRRIVQGRKVATHKRDISLTEKGLTE